jgi:predicted RNA-binding Zn-ribbon protein involved in translation (DUF1610 family)
MAETTSHPCPLCGMQQLVYDGIVRWRSGTRPPRSLARPREALGFSPRADYDESAYYHCASCGAEFVDHLISRHGPVTLQAVGGGPDYVYDENTQEWQARRR